MSLLERADAWQASRRLLTDALLAAVVTFLVLITAVDAGVEVGFREPDALSWALLTLGSAPLVARRAAPRPVLAVMTGALSTYNALGYPIGVATLGALFAIYTVAAAEPPERSRPLLGVSVLALAISPYLYDAPVRSLVWVAAIFYAIPWAIGAWRRKRWTIAEAQAQRMQAALAEERARIARELHDVVSHAISVVVVQAQAAKRAGQGEALDAALDSIERTGRQALNEMRRLLDVLRTDGDDGAREPQPSLADLSELAAAVGRTGLPVDVSTEGRPRPLEPGLELAAYRIAQEALTNVVKHAGASRASVVLRYADDHVELRIDDDGRGDPAAAANGQGLLGMRERVAVYGGQLETGPRPDGGYRVVARLPAP